MKISVKYKLLVPVLLFIILGFIALSYVAYSKSSKSLVTAINEALDDKTTSLQEIINLWMEDREQELEEFARQRVLAEGLESNASVKSLELAHKRLLDLKNEYEIYDGIFIANSKGLCVLSSDMSEVKSLDVSQREYFKEAMGGRIAVSDVIKHAVSKKLIFTISVPLKKSDTITGVLVSIVDMERFNTRFIDKIKSGKAGYAYMINPRGLIIAYPDKEQILALDVSKYDFGKDMIAKGTGSIKYNFSGVDKIVSYRKINTTNWIVAITANWDDIMAPVISLFYWILAISGICIVFVVAVVFITTGIILKPIAACLHLARTIANGDLTKRLNIKAQDEFGDLAAAMNDTAISLSGLVSEIQGNAEALSSSSEEFSAVASQLAAGAEEMTAQAQVVSGAADLMSENINSMASSSEEMSSNSRNVSAAAEQISNFMTTVAAAVEESLTNLTSVATASEEMSSTVGEIAKNTEKSREVTQNAVSAVGKTSEQIQTLSTASQEISKVIETIVEIAEQTKLLALNATIEAARAGEAGKGFAVVASEVKELAKQTNSATDDIRKRIGAMQSSTEATVSDIKTIQNAINDVDEIVNTIAAAVEEQNVTVQENVRNITQATDGVKEVAKSVTEVNKGVDDIAKNISEVATGANNVSQQSANAASGVKDVTDNIKGVTQAASDTSQAAQQVNISAEDLAKMAMGLQESAGKFKVSTGEEHHVSSEKNVFEHHETPKSQALKKPERKELPGGHKK